MKQSITSSVVFCLILLFLAPHSATARDRDRRRPKNPIATSVLYPDALPDKAEKSPRMTHCKAMSLERRNTGRINSRYREGIDVSHYQERIDWDAVAAAGEISYVYLKATEGESYVDRTYDLSAVLIEIAKCVLRHLTAAILNNFDFFHRNTSLYFYPQFPCRYYIYILTLQNYKVNKRLINFCQCKKIFTVCKYLQRLQVLYRL